VSLVCLAVAGCSGGESEQHPWPEVHGYEIYEGATAETVIDSLIAGTHQAFGDEYDIERTAIYAIDDDVERDRLQADHESLLDGWDDLGATGRTPITRSWERGDQRFTLVFLTLDDQRLAVTLATQRR
jgi:hypothetical protein